MRTTIDLPDDLFRRAKATAAMRGLKLKELFTMFIENGLAEEPKKEKFGHKGPIPVSIPIDCSNMPPLTTNEELLQWLDRQDEMSRDRPA